MKSLKKIEKAFEQILECLHEEFGLDTSDPNFQNTPSRIAKAYAEIFSGLEDTQKQVEEILTTSFPCKSNEMVIMQKIEVFSVCPHHFLPVLMTVDLAYIPSKNVLGLSKLARLASILSKRPSLQETYTQDLTKALMKVEGCKGAAALVRGKHLCMIMRGVSKTSAVTVTSSLEGVFADEDATRAEFLNLVRKS